MNNLNGYLEILTAIVQRQFGVLGTEKALAGAREAGLEVLDNGIVKMFTDDGNSATEKLIECYVGYAGLTAKIGCIMLAKKIAGKHGITLSNL
ncbi:MAG: hypothetical protein HON76_00460 [Candidatus Scalindua sp.]|jgi:hypothetical protein|nr:hypothetical protein [Candidatus Scalindua sp.]MBT6560984.1 hypothetical protein [Candidatus Scalindua sp.]